MAPVVPTSWLTSSTEPVGGPALALSSALTVYRAAVSDFAEANSALLAVVTAEEQARAGRYLRPADRARFLMGRACLRVLLGRLLQCPPAAVPLVFNAFGKPELAPPSGIQFNVAHSGAWVLVALGAQPVGIDVEKVAPDFDYRTVAAHSFSPAEQAAIHQAADPRAAFYAHWVQQEAQAKADGHGLLNDFASKQTGEWTVHRFDLAPGYAAALAHSAGWRPTLEFRTWDVSSIGWLCLPLLLPPALPCPPSPRGPLAV